MSKVIKVENVGKSYHLGALGKDTFFSELFKGRKAEDLFWALKDVSFHVNQGEVLGIVGKNGAGKSTLLKLLSRITSPTEGSIKIHGRVASLLEVGTGFHPELTGRDNIFLNGAILGMKRNEIARKLDEIVSFSGVEKFLDTPVKRYSSGMYVRLAFAVAAHLEPEILIIDEVLAVGDAEFQSKCLGKMGEVAKSGRTVLFVSHTMSSVKTLCSRGILLESGRVAFEGEIDNVVDEYLSANLEEQWEKQWNKSEYPEEIGAWVSQAKLHSTEKQISLNSAFTIEFKLNMEQTKKFHISLHLFNANRDHVFNVNSETQDFDKGVYQIKFDVPGNLLNEGKYHFAMNLIENGNKMVYTTSDVINFEVVEDKRDMDWFGKWPGIVRPSISSQVHRINI